MFEPAVNPLLPRIRQLIELISRRQHEAVEWQEIDAYAAEAVRAYGEVAALSDRLDAMLDVGIPGHDARESFLGVLGVLEHWLGYAQLVLEFAQFAGVGPDRATRLTELKACMDRAAKVQENTRECLEFIDHSLETLPAAFTRERQKEAEEATYVNTMDILADIMKRGPRS